MKPVSPGSSSYPTSAPGYTSSYSFGRFDKTVVERALKIFLDWTLLKYYRRYVQFPENTLVSPHRRLRILVNELMTGTSGRYIIPSWSGPDEEVDEETWRELGLSDLEDSEEDA